MSRRSVRSFCAIVSPVADGIAVNMAPDPGDRREAR